MSESVNSTHRQKALATINLTGEKIGSIGRIPFQISQAELVPV